jgi:hypothetical protein
MCHLKRIDITSLSKFQIELIGLLLKTKKAYHLKCGNLALFLFVSNHGNFSPKDSIPFSVSLAYTYLFLSNAEGGTRTPTGLPTTPSR